MLYRSLRSVSGVGWDDEGMRAHMPLKVEVVHLSFIYLVDPKCSSWQSWKEYLASCSESSRKNTKGILEFKSSAGDGDEIYTKPFILFKRYFFFFISIWL